MTARPFIFDTEFDAAGDIVRASAWQPARRAFSPAEVDARVDAARSEAREAALAETASQQAAALSTIAQNLYEAAAADGAGRWRRLWHITLPGLRPVIVLLLILRLGDALSVGFEQFLLQRDAVGRQAAEVLDTFVYHFSIATGNYGYGAAAGLFKAVIGLVLILAANRVAHMLGERGIYSKS